MAAPLIPELIRVPRAWFIDPVRTSLRKKVRPCTALTRRKQLSINTQVPFRTFEELLAGFADGELEGLERDVGGRLKTTSRTASLLRYKYIINRGSLLDKFFSLDEVDKLLHTRGPRLAQGRRWKRSLGCARLFLAAAQEARGLKASVMAMVCGNVVIELRAPKAFKAMPRLTINFFVLSMDAHGHIVWPVDFAARTKAALRKQARTLLKRMLDDDSYPVDPSMSEALTAASDSRLHLQPPRLVRAHPSPEVLPQAVPLRPNAGS